MKIFLTLYLSIAITLVAVSKFSTSSYKINLIEISSSIIESNSRIIISAVIESDSDGNTTDTVVVYIGILKPDGSKNYLPFKSVTNIPQKGIKKISFELEAPFLYGKYWVDCDIYDNSQKIMYNTTGFHKYFFEVVKKLAVSSNEYFDDFIYNSIEDILYNKQNIMEWIIEEGIKSPPAGAQYKKENVFIESDSFDKKNKHLVLRTKTSNKFQDLECARIESPVYFLEGTYAARVYFDNSPARYNDGNVETFYIINDFPEGDTNYSECDFEYLPWDVWGDDDFSSKIHLSTWETYISEPWNPDKKTTLIKGDFSGWHTLLFQITNGYSVKYFIDGILAAEHDYSAKGHDVYPEKLMQISIANWIWTRESSPEIGLGNFPEIRTCYMKVDWIYHAENQELSHQQVLENVNKYRSKSILRVNKMKRQ